jgi:cytochrome c-type biogenesis protein CcmE
MAQAQSKFFKFGGGIAIILAALGYLAWTGVQEGKSYYVTIKQLHAPDNSMYGKHLRLYGIVQPGSIQQTGTNADFVLVDEGETQRVTYKGTEPPPDTFKDNSQALAIGEFGRDGVFHAKELQAKCASKYAPQQGAAAPPASKGY